MTEPELLQQVDRTYVRLDRRRLSYFAGCDYFRMSTHPAVIAGLAAGARKYGLNVAASRLTTGNHLVYEKLEEELAAFFGTQAALVTSTGYLAARTVAEALAGSFSHALIDAEAHPAVVNAAQALDCPMLRFKSCDVEDLRLAVKRCGPAARPMVLTDGMFSHNGAAAPLRQYLALLPSDGIILVDDAHGAGVLGARGRGTPEHEGVGGARVIQTISLSKAFGVFGGAVLADARLRRRMMERSRCFVGSTPLPLPLAQAAVASCRVLARGSHRRRLFANSATVKQRLRAAGWPLPEFPGPIVALRPKNRMAARRLKQALLAASIYPSFIRYASGPAGGYFRFVISSEHSPRQLDCLCEVLERQSQRDFDVTAEVSSVRDPR